MADDIIVRDGQGNLAVNVVTSTEANVPYNYDDCFTLDINNRRALRVVGAGGGGGGAVSSVNGKTGAVVLDAEDVGALPEDTPIPDPQVQSDWDQTDPTAVDYIKNKPVIPTSSGIPQYDIMPTASASNVGEIAQYSGETNQTYTHGYIYENQYAPIYTGTVSFEPATLSGTTVACSGDDFANFLTESGVSPLSVVSGTMTYDSASALWVLVGKDSDGNTVLTFQEHQQDYEDAGFTFTGTPQDGDIIAFTCTVAESADSYKWVRIDVQPATTITVTMEP